MNILRKKTTKIALTLSVVVLLLWAVLGTGTSLAWFTDVTPAEKNTFQVGKLDLKVSYLKDGTYKGVTSETSVFDDEALYEPGYVQVVYLKIENVGDVPFDFCTAVRVDDFTTGINVFGNTFHLQDHLRFGVVTNDDESALKAAVDTRDEAELNATADMPLNTYDTDVDHLGVGEQTYMALIVRMPKGVTNVANHNGAQPRVELGLVVKATQEGTPLN